MVNPAWATVMRLGVEGRLSKYSVPRMLEGIATWVWDREPKSTVTDGVWAAL